MDYEFHIQFVFTGIKGIVRYMRFRRSVLNDLLWERDIPLGGDLRQANLMLRALKEEQNGGLISAAILKLVSLGAFAIQQTAEGDTLVAQMANASTLPAIFKAADYGISHYERPKSAIRERYERALGGGGSASSGGGGGGFSGGGGGGGVR